MHAEPATNLEPAAETQSADVVALASSSRARSSSSFEVLEGESSSCSFDAEKFAAAIAPLEAKAERALNGPGLLACQQAFAEAPDEFHSLTRDALKRGRNPLALLIRMVNDGDHAKPVPRQETSGERLQRRIAEREGK
jgi:hypothetical protein